MQEYVTTATSGFEISGTSIKNFDKESSKQATLRKPDVILPDVLNRTEKQIEKIWNTLTTKIDTPLSDYIKKIQDGSVSENMKISTKKLQHFDIFNNINTFRKRDNSVWVNYNTRP